VDKATTIDKKSVDEMSVDQMSSIHLLPRYIEVVSLVLDERVGRARRGFEPAPFAVAEDEGIGGNVPPFSGAETRPGLRRRRVGVGVRHECHSEVGYPARSVVNVIKLFLI
jgi:hypothetical protein